MSLPTWPAVVPITLRLVFLAILSVTFPACVSSRVEVLKESESRQKQWATLCRDTAMLSAIAYRSGKTEVPSELRSFEMKLKQRGWRMLGHCDRTEGAGKGLCFEVWENRKTSPRTIVFAFRGTQSGLDWGANLRWFRFMRSRSAGDHYDALREECLPIIKRYYEASSDRPVIITTGHSLGGGLAQQLLYAASDKVDHCIAFDSSPVTGFYDLDEEVRKQYHRLPNRSGFSQYRIIRAYERGEVLSIPRNALAAFYKPDTLTRSIEFDSNKVTKEVHRIVRDYEQGKIQRIPRNALVAFCNPDTLAESDSNKVAQELRRRKVFGAVARHSIVMLAQTIEYLAERDITAVKPVAPKLKDWSDLRYQEVAGE